MADLSSRPQLRAYKLERGCSRSVGDNDVPASPATICIGPGQWNSVLVRWARTDLQAKPKHVLIAYRRELGGPS